MKNCITVTADERATLLDYLRQAPQPELRQRAHIVLLLADGYTWASIAAVLYCSSRTIARWKGRFDQGRTEALLGHPRGAPARLAGRWAAVLLSWVQAQTPRAFGFFRSRWCCGVLALLLWQRHGVAVSRETVRRWLRGADYVWRRPRPYRKIHVICDNASFHYNCWAVWEFVAQYGDRVVLHFLPKYAPECNPIERVWWHLHEEITRNHQCRTLEELVDLVFGWLD